jgi:cytidylate kinase
MDAMTRREAKKGSVVLDGQLVGWMAGDFANIKVYLKAPLSVRVSRLASRDGVSLEEASRELLHREAAERERYKSLYGIDVGDISIYEVILDTALLGLESTREVLRTIVREYISAYDR